MNRKSKYSAEREESDYEWSCCCVSFILLIQFLVII